MHRLKSALLIVALGAFQIAPVMAAGDPIFASDKLFARQFTAVSEMASPSGKAMTVTRSCDGKGRMRLDINAGTNAMSMIYDKNKQICTQLRTSRKMAMRVAMKLGASSPPPVTRELGTKTIDGHPCKGQLLTVEGAPMEVWIGQDIDYPVLMSHDDATGHHVTRLKSYSAKAPAAANFEIPADYKVMGAP